MNVSQYLDVDTEVRPTTADETAWVEIENPNESPMTLFLRDDQGPAKLVAGLAETGRFDPLAEFNMALDIVREQRGLPERRA